MRDLLGNCDRAHQLLSAVSTGRASDSVNYMYDKAGKPTSRKELGITSACAFNNLNQFSSGSWTGSLTVVGEVNYAAGTVTVNSVTGKIFPDRIFEVTNVTVSAGTNVLTAVYHGPAFTNTQMVATNTSTVIMDNPAFGYDAKGNLTNDSDFVYQFDIANRLTNAISKASGSSVLAARYDGLGRRVEVTRTGSTVERYVYFPGSFLVLAVLDGSNQIKEIYTHGPDLSGVVGGAGGIGGILSVSTNIGATSASKYFHADALGNVILVSGSDGKQVASYGFTPFGKLVNQGGTYQARFLFSSKEADLETGLLHFGFRDYSPSRGHFLTRDPLEEHPGPNLYRFVKNNPLTRFDALGLKSSATPWEVGWDWLTGEGPGAYNFESGDPFLEDLRKHVGIQEARREIAAKLAENCQKCDGRGQGQFRHSLSGPLGVVKYIRDYSVIATGGRFGGNLAATFLGSYRGTWDAIAVSCCKGTASVALHIRNEADAESGTRFPVLGYQDRPSIQDLLTQRRVAIPGSILSNNPFGSEGPLRTVYMTFDWEEVIQFKRNPNCED